MAFGVAFCLLLGSGCGNGDGTPGGGSDAGGDVTEPDAQGDVENDVDMSSEVCDDGVDNDDDMDVDCRDEDCDGAAACSFTQLAASRSHACGVLESGHVVCWGFNAEGQVGNGETASQPVAPTVVEGLDSIVDVAVGLDHTCALSADGSVYCWGSNEEGQLGDDSFVSSPFPVGVVGLTNAAALSAGGLHTCAVTSDESSRVLCWGLNDRYQIGVTGGEQIRVPTEVQKSGTAIRGYTDVASGIQHNCAMSPLGGGSGHTIICWGDGQMGQQGNGRTNIQRSAPIESVRQKSNDNEIRDFVAGSLAAGQNSTCAIRQGGSVWCWGDGSAGHFGSEALAESQYAAVEYQGLGDAQRIWHELFHVCAERASGRVACWGENGQFAFDDEAKVHLNPVLLHDLVEPNDVAPGDQFTCWADSEGRTFCQGASNSGQLGKPSLTQATAEPQRVYPEWSAP
jgi:alpha-tubulin suppressor-like RCC1 family protein